MYILSRNGAPDANPYYEVAWALYPIWRWIAGPADARLISVEMPPAVWAVGPIIDRRRPRLRSNGSWKGGQLAGFARSCSLLPAVYLGLVNFEFGLGVTLWASTYLMWRSAHGGAFRRTRFPSRRCLLRISFDWASMARRSGYDCGVLRPQLTYRDAALRLCARIPALGAVSCSCDEPPARSKRGHELAFEFKPLWLFAS